MEFGCIVVEHVSGPINVSFDCVMSIWFGLKLHSELFASRR